MDPVRQNPIQRTVRSVHVCALHCAQLLRTILHRTDLIIFPLTLHCSNDVYLREGGNKTVQDSKIEGKSVIITNSLVQFPEKRIFRGYSGIFG